MDPFADVMAVLADGLGSNESVQTIQLTYDDTQETVTVEKAIRKGSGIDDPSLGAKEFAAADGGFMDDGTVFLLPLKDTDGNPLRFTPKDPRIGDKIEDADGNIWTTQEIGKPAGALWRVKVT